MVDYDAASDDSGNQKMKYASNQHFDEAIDLSDDDDNLEDDSDGVDGNGDDDGDDGGYNDDGRSLRRGRQKRGEEESSEEDNDDADGRGGRITRQRGDTPPRHGMDDDPDDYGDSDEELRVMSKETHLMAKSNELGKDEYIEHRRRDMGEESEDPLSGEPRSRLERGARNQGADDDGEHGTESDAGDGDESGKSDASAVEDGAYNPDDYADLDVSEDVANLFTFIVGYKPMGIVLDTKLSPFIPTFIPCVGDIDPFIHVARPDEREENHGLRSLNEPGGQQSDTATLELKLRSLSRNVSKNQRAVHSIENAGDHKKAVQDWIKNISALHEENPPQVLTYQKAMPDIEVLMEQWPAGVDTALNGISLPSSSLDIDIKNYAKVICALLDIPTYKNKTIESVHCLFTLFSVFRDSQHFAHANATTAED